MTKLPNRHEFFYDNVKNVEICERGFAGMRFIGLRRGLLLETEWADELYGIYGSPEGIYHLAQAR